MVAKKKSPPKRSWMAQFKRDPTNKSLNELKKWGIPKPVTKAAVLLTVVGALSTSPASPIRKRLASLPIVGPWASIIMNWGSRLRGDGYMSSRRR